MIATQIYWVKEAYDVRRGIFNSKVQEALNHVAGSILRSNENFSPSENLVEREENNFYTVLIGDDIDSTSLQHLLVRELSGEGIESDFEYGIYSCDANKIKYSRYVFMDEEKRGLTKAVITPFPKNSKENNYFGVFFPKRNFFFSDGMLRWVISSALLFATLLLLGSLIFIIFRQRRLSEIQKNFVNNMTHEFKTPLATIKISSEVLKNPNIVNNPQRLLNYATIVSNETAHLTQQVERVLQMAKSTKGSIQLNKEEIHLPSMMLELTDKTYSPLVRSRGGELEVSYYMEDIVLIADKLHLKNAISNLLDNAIKYCKTAPKIYVDITEQKNMIRIAVKDNGIGISQENVKNVFKKFFRVPTGNIHDVKGFGLGLNYVRLICLEHGGNITVESELGKGSEFCIFIPK